MSHMRRREFITLLGGAAAARPLAAGAQQPKMATVGILVTGNTSPEAFLQGFRAALATTGLIEGQNVQLELRSAEGSDTLLPQKATELVRLKADVIVASLTPAVQAARHATSDIPIVMAPAGDPVATGLISSLARPGGNITGVSAAAVETAGKRLELIRELFPSVRRVAVLANESDPFALPFVAQLGQSARSIGIEIEPILVRPGAPQAPAFEAMSAKRLDAFIIELGTIRPDTAELAIRHRLPSSGPGAWPLAGGLIGYSGNVAEIHRLAADYVDKILKGRRPADLPVALPTKFDLAINLKTAKALGLEVPPALLARADEVIE
jgi:putative tryptophan/tyrosine transport system substrate-binding protein